MRKILSILICFICLFSSCAAELIPLDQSPPAFTYGGRWQISAKQLTNNSVGHKWTRYYEVDSIKYDQNQIYQYRCGDSILFYARIKEHDSKPDVGTRKITYTPTQRELEFGFTFDFKVTVKENNGPYSGNTSTWKVSVKWIPDSGLDEE